MSDTFNQPTAGTPNEQPATTTGKSQEEILQILQRRVDDSQAFIKKITEENAQMREALSKFSTIEARLEEIARANAQPAAPVNDGTQAPVFDEAAILDKAQKLVFDKLSSDRIKEAEDNNFRTVSSQLTQIYGEKVDEVVADVAKQNDMSFDEAVAFAKAKPKAFLKLFDTKQAAPFQPSTSINTQGFNSGTKHNEQPIKVNPFDTKSLLARAEQLQRQLTGA